MKGNTDMVNILNALDFIGNRIGCIKEILSELNFEANKVFLYKSQTEIFIEFIDRFGIVNNLSDELENVALPDLIDEMPTSNSVLIYFMNDFSEPNMLYTYRVTSYPNVEIWKNENICRVNRRLRISSAARRLKNKHLLKPLPDESLPAG